MYYGKLLRQMAEAIRDLSDVPRHLNHESVDRHKEAVNAASERQDHNDEIRQKWSEKEFTENQIAEKDQSRRDDRHYDTQKSIKAATWIAAIGALFYGGVATYQALEMRRATEATTRSADIAACALRENQRQFQETLSEITKQTKSQEISAQAAKDAVNLAQNQMMQDQRPWVGLMGSDHISATIAKDSPIKIRLQFQNVGRSPALDEAGVNKLTIRPIHVPMPSFDNYSKNDAGPTIAMMPNATANANIGTDTLSDHGLTIKLTDADMTAINTGQVQLFIYGSIWYNDTFRKPHRTDYCLQYFPPSGSNASGGETNFGACPVHNYAD